MSGGQNVVGQFRFLVWNLEKWEINNPWTPWPRRCRLQSASSWGTVGSKPYTVSVLIVHLPCNTCLCKEIEWSCLVLLFSFHISHSHQPQATRFTTFTSKSSTNNKKKIWGLNNNYLFLFLYFLLFLFLLIISIRRRWLWQRRNQLHFSTAFLL